MRESEELEAIKRAVQDVGLPEYVHGLEFEFDDDWSGDPAVWIMVIISDEMADSDSFPQWSLDIRKRIMEAVRGADASRRPYVRFWSESDHAELAREGRA